jgi:Permuted papain-like amidase enzyme, YaeF/YiiX, C92 family
MTSALIRISTFSRYSHAAIYLGDNLYAEAVDLGVRVRSVGTIVKKRLKVVRLREIDGVDVRDIARRAVDRVDHYLHLPYWLQGALLSGFVRAGAGARRSMFCSHLVAQCYADVGIAVAGARKAENITPGRLARSRAFGDVSSQTVIRAHYLPEYLVLFEFKTLSDKETQIIQSMVESLQPVFAARLRPVPSDWFAMLRLVAGLPRADVKAALDAEVIRIMRESGYLRLTDDAIEESLNPLKTYRETVRHAALSPKEREVESALLTNSLRALRKQLGIHEENRVVYLEELRKSGLTTFRLLAENQFEHHRICGQLIEATEALLAELRVE